MPDSFVTLHLPQGDHRQRLITEWRERAIKNIESIIFAVDAEDVVVRDTVTNLLHWCNAKEVDFENELRIARDNFEAEVAGME